MVEITEKHRKQHVKKLKCIPLSANTVGSCRENIAKDLKKHILEKIMQCKSFAVQLTESACVSNMSQFMVFARLCFNNKIHSELLLCEPLKERCTRGDKFSTVNDF